MKADKNLIKCLFIFNQLLNLKKSILFIYSGCELFREIVDKIVIE